MLEQDLAYLPEDAREQLAILELELSEGDITQKGYEKKRRLILTKYCQGYNAGLDHAKGSPGTRAHRHHQRRLTRDESRFHSEIRAEAVQQALAEYSQGNKAHPAIVQPIRRTAESRGRCSHTSDSSSDDDDSLAGSLKKLSHASGNHNIDHCVSNNRNANFSSPPDVTGGAAVEAMLRRVQEQHETKYKRETEVISKIASPDVEVHRGGAKSVVRVDSHPNTNFEVEKVTSLEEDVVYVNQDRIKSPNGRTTLHDVNYQNAAFSQLRSRKMAAVKRERRARAVSHNLWGSFRSDLRNVEEKLRNCRLRRENYTKANIRDQSFETIRKELKKRRDSNYIPQHIPEDIFARPSIESFNKELGKKFQENELYDSERKFSSITLHIGYNGRINVNDLPPCLLHSIQRPSTQPLSEYYKDYDAELEAVAKMIDPAAPRPEGQLMNPVRGDSVGFGTQNHPRSLDSALHRYGTSIPKSIAAIVLDQTGRPGQQVTYGKLLSRSNKVAFMLLNRTLSGGKDNVRVPLCRPGDRVALVYPNTEPLAFLVAFYGCILAGVVPVPVEVPLTKRDAGIQQLGFLLGSCGVKVALTSDTCYKGLPKCTISSNQFSRALPSGSNPLIGNPQEMVDLKSWPRLYWVITEHLGKPSREWTAPLRVADESIAYIEYSCDRDGAVKGVCISREAMLAHCRSITTAMEYKQGEFFKISDTMVCVLDFKREVGLWHAVLASVFNGMRVVFVPYSLMKINPASWMLMATKLLASVALVKSRDLHWGLLATRDHKDVNLSSLRSLIVADGANPWSLSSCDQFAAVFAAHGLRAEAMCPCSGSSETGTISLRRRSSNGNGTSGRGILSMAALSHSVVRVDKENSLTSLTIQDAGQVIPSGSVVVLKQTGPARLCRADELGEICLCANSTGSAYWGLEGVSTATFKIEPLGLDDRPFSPRPYVRSGLIGFMGPDGLVFVVGRRTTQLNISGRHHSADDIIATVLAVEPMRFVYRGRIAVFSVSVLRDERIVIVAEQKPGATEEDAFTWMSRVLQAVDAIHQVGVYCLALVPANQLPKTPLGGIHVSETRQCFEAGELHPSTLLMCPHSCVINLPKPRNEYAVNVMRMLRYGVFHMRQNIFREVQPDIGPASMLLGNIVQGVRIAGAQGRCLGTEDDMVGNLLEILRSRSLSSPDHKLFTLVTAKNSEQDSATCSSLLKYVIDNKMRMDFKTFRRAERIGSFLAERNRLNVGDHVALIFPPGIDLIAAFYGCLVAGVVPVCVRAPSPSSLQSELPSVRMIVDVSRAVAIVSNTSVCKLLKCKEAAHRVDSKAWPMILDIEDSPASWKRKTNTDLPEPLPSDPCYLDFSVSTTGQLVGVIVSVAGALSMCKSLKVACELYPSRHVALCLDPYSGLGFALWCLSSIYSGHHTILIPPTEVEICPSLWLTTVSTLKDFSVRTCVVVAEERPRATLVNAFSRLFAPLCLSPRAVSTSFGCRVNAAICMQGATGPDPSSVYVDARALRNDRVTLVGKGAPHSLLLMESGKLLPGVKVVIANPETRGQCADSHLGEIWVAAPHNAIGYFTVFGEETNLHTDHFNARLAFGDTMTKFARTGYLGFLRRTQSITEDGELHDAIFVVGALEETLMLRGMRYHPVDIEATISRCHKYLGDCAVFTWSHLIVVVAECSGRETDALDLIPAVTSSVLEEHYLIVGVVVIVDPNTIPLNSRGEKQRHLLRENFLHDQLDPIYVAYNM
ncbi:AMP-binding enzyme [Dictyocaulus viviparus]|uniref:AMP-binding enzyme n=1 Tax=Dictyocaulus viviparus TaxID=29172 RepID=A0A0D8YAP0_DICVI|nr:AMP-binding enzyme [Dictyocaulus viviparus]